MDGQYNIYPSFSLGTGRIAGGFDALAQRLAGARQAVIDGFPGVLWEDFRDRLAAALHARGVRAAWCNVGSALLPPRGDRRADRTLPGRRRPDLRLSLSAATCRAFFDPRQLAQLAPDPAPI